MRTAVVGANGQLGTDLLKVLPGELVPLGRDDLDVVDAERVHDVVRGGRFDRVVNCAAYNQVDRAEDEPEAAFAGNALGPRHLARACHENDVVLLHVGTDYVFGRDATRDRPYTEEDVPGPTSVYGTSKLAGESFVLAECTRSFVVRTCGLYGHAEGRPNFVRTMLRLGRERGAVSVVDDQHCTPTSTADLAESIRDLLATEAFGLYHATNAGRTTWFEFAGEIFRAAGLDVDVTAITTAEFGARARRPGYSVLDNTKLNSLLGREPRTWREAVVEFVAGPS